MPLLFSYGTLQDKQVQLTLFGRALVGRKDRLIGYEQVIARVTDPEFARTTGKTEHSILRPARSRAAEIDGMALELTDSELKRTDEYEPAEYKRVLGRLSSGGQAWVYVDAQFADEPA